MRIFPAALCRGIEKLHGDVLCLNRRSEVTDPMLAMVLMAEEELLR